VDFSKYNDLVYLDLETVLGKTKKEILEYLENGNEKFEIRVSNKRMKTGGISESEFYQAASSIM